MVLPFAAPNLYEALKSLFAALGALQILTAWNSKHFILSELDKILIYDIK